MTRYRRCVYLTLGLISLIPSILADSSTRDETGARHVRDSGTDIFHELAALSGGHVIDTDKDHLAGALGIIDASTMASPVAITKFEVHADISGAERTFHVDSTVRQIIVEVRSDHSKPMFKLSDPTRRHVTPSDANVTKVADTGTLLSIRVVNPATGQWRLSFDDRQHYDVTVFGDSVVDFTYTFLDSSSYMPMSGNPLTGQSLYVSIQVEGMEDVGNVTELWMTSLKGDLLKVLSVGAARGRVGNQFMMLTELPPQNFRFELRAVDKHDNTLVRVGQTPVRPQVIAVALNDIGTDMPSPGTEYVLGFIINNYGPEGQFLVDVDVANTKFSTTYQPHNPILSRNGNVTGTIRIRIHNTAHAGETADIMVTVTGPTDSSQFVSTTLFVGARLSTTTVLTPSSAKASGQPKTTPPMTKSTSSGTHARQTTKAAPQWTTVTAPTMAGRTVTAAVRDSINPVCEQLVLTSDCSGDPNCQLGRWKVSFQVHDDESGIRSVSMDGATSDSTFYVEQYHKGLSIVPVRANYSATCCQTHVTIVVKDMEGNVLRYPVRVGSLVNCASPGKGSLPCLPTYDVTPSSRSPAHALIYPRILLVTLILLQILVPKLCD